MESSRAKTASREAPPKRSGAGYPFGETRFTTGTMYTDKLFTGQREMAGLGIYHYGARFYSPKLGRFLSADSIVPGYANPQNLNRFSYVRNNPLRYTDPTGHLIDEGCGCGNTGTTRRTVITVVAGRRTRDSDSGRTFVPWSDLQVLSDRPTDIATSSPTEIPTAPITPSDLPTDPLSESDHYGDEPITFTQPEPEHNGNPVISIVGVVLAVQLGILDTILSIGVVAVAQCGFTVPGCQVGLAGELVLIPLDFISWNLTIYAAQMAATGSTDHDPLPILHGFAPNILPYEP